MLPWICSSIECWVFRFFEKFVGSSQTWLYLGIGCLSLCTISWAVFKVTWSIANFVFLYHEVDYDWYWLFCIVYLTMKGALAESSVSYTSWNSEVYVCGLINISFGVGVLVYLFYGFISVLIIFTQSEENALEAAIGMLLSYIVSLWG